MRARRSVARFVTGIMLFLAAAVFVLEAGQIHAASQRELTLRQKIELSEEIVVGRVSRLESQWQGRLIVTIATLDVEETIAGRSVPRTLQITQVGGSAVHPDTGLAVTLTASSHVAMAEGQSLLLFVSRSPQGLRQIVGAQQGMFRVQEDARSAERTLPVGPKKLVVVRGDQNDVVRAEPITLDEMRKRIRADITRLGTATGGGR